MNINPEIEKILSNFNIPVKKGILYLLGIFHNLIDSPENDPFEESVGKQINLTKIVIRDSETPGNVIWNVPLYDGQTSYMDRSWEWVQAWRELFGKLRSDAIGSKQDCLKKMKKYFAEHPEVRKDDVLLATEMYLTDFRLGKQNVQYLQRADYFISKIVKAEGGTQYSSRLDMYLEIISKNKDVKANPLLNRQLNKVVK